jgi:hypothetical protein
MDPDHCCGSRKQILELLDEIKFFFLSTDVEKHVRNREEARVFFV